MLDIIGEGHIVSAHLRRSLKNMRGFPKTIRRGVLERQILVEVHSRSKLHLVNPIIILVKR